MSEQPKAEGPNPAASPAAVPEAGAAPSKFALSDRIFRFLFVSPAYFTDAFAQQDFELTVVFRSFDRKGGDRMAFAGPNARSTFMLSFEAPEPEKKPGVVIPQYTHVAEEISALIGAFYGKFVINAGQMQSGERLTVPTMWEAPCHSHALPPFNMQPRRPDGPELRLRLVEKLLEVYFYRKCNEEDLNRIVRAAEFYRMALENFHERPEMAYTLLLSSLEAIIDLGTYTEEQIYDEKLRERFDQIAEQCKDGKKIVSDLKSRLFQIRRRVGILVNEFIPDSFFLQREAREEFATIRAREDLRNRVVAAYDMRSRLLHTGNLSGIGHLTHNSMGEEFVLGTPVLSDPDLVKLLVKALTLAGLERVTSTVLRTVIYRHLLRPVLS